MKIQTTYKFSENEINMLRSSLPPNPCDSCGANHGFCCGCHEQSKYTHILSVYESAGLLEFAKAITKIRNNRNKIIGLDSQIVELHKEIASTLEKLPSELKMII